MLLRNRFIVSFTVAAFAALCLNTAPCRADLADYLRKPEAQFEWQLNQNMSGEVSGDRIYDLSFVSQTWQETHWRHQLQIYQPLGATPSSTMFLWVTGGAGRGDDVRLGMELARKVRAPVAFLYHIPNQPLLEGDLSEDHLIAETFVRYLKTDDQYWPLLFPMVKSVVKAMDVLQAFGKKEWSEAIDKFIVGGASKRGWATWLTGAVDKRVGAVVPVVIDVLNMREQMQRQLKAFGGYSSRLAPYSSRGLLPIPDTPKGRRLLAMVDPWAYRERLTLPKLIINGTNDFYWATDALNLYWDGIPDDKWVLYVPNAGHNLRRRDRPRRDQLNYFVDGIAAFSRHQISGAPMPKLSWKYEAVNGKLRLTIAATPAPKGARLWVAQTSTLDFRKAQWSPQDAHSSNGKIVGEVKPPATGHLAVFGELDYAIDGLRYHLSTQLRLTE